MQIFQRIKHWLTVPESEGIDPKNFICVQIDSIGVALANAASPFLPVFLTRLGAETIHIGLLSSMPGITGLITSIPLGRFLQNRKNVVPWFSAARLAVILSYAMTSIATLLFSDHSSIYAILVIWALATIPQTIVAITFNVVMNSVAGPTGRFELMSRRWSIMGVTTATCAFLVGILLDNVVFPLNYQLAFFFLSIGAFLSYRFSSRIQIEDQEIQSAKDMSHREKILEDFKLVKSQSSFVDFVSRRFVFTFGSYFAIPLLPLYYVREAQASDAWIAVITTVQTAVTIIGYALWTRQTRKFGSRRVLLITTLGVAIFPILVALTHQEILITIFAGIMGISSAGVNLIFFDELMQTIPPKYSATFMSISQSLEFLAAVIAPLIGSLIANHIGLSYALIIGGSIRVAGFVLFLIRPIYYFSKA
ncbi:MAG: MFS transporter [Anaerolineaceae bacterium]